MKWNIITDSSCDMFGFDKEHENIVFSSVPFTISVGDENFVDDRNLDVDGMIDSMDACAEASHTACPSPHAWQEKFEQEGNVIAITISSKLSGSYNSACAAKDMVLEEQPDKKIAVIDSRSAGSELVLLVKKICELIESGADFETVVEKAELYSRHTHVVFALSSFNNLVKNGRAPKLAGQLTQMLNIRLAVSPEWKSGEIKAIKKGRGAKRIVTNTMADCLAFLAEYPGSSVRVLTTGAAEEQELVSQALAGQDYVDAGTGPIGCTIATHVGVDAIAISYCPRYQPTH